MGTFKNIHTDIIDLADSNTESVIIWQKDNMVQAASDFNEELEQITSDLNSLHDQIEFVSHQLDCDEWDGHIRTDIEHLDRLMTATMGRLLDVAKLRGHLLEAQMAETIMGFFIETGIKAIAIDDYKEASNC